MKTVLITGSNSGIGFYTTKLFLEKGFKVFAHYHYKNDKLKDIKDKNLVLIKADLNRTSNANKLMEKIFRKTQKLDILINNAGLYEAVESFEELSIEHLERALNVNLKSPYILSKLYIDMMKKYSKGNIVNISSIGVKFNGSINSLPYTISKAALEKMTLAMSKEASKFNIMINALRIGVTNTDIHSKASNKNLDKRIDLIPLKRMAEPNEIAKYIYFISTEENTYMTGSIITIAGGE